MFKKLSVEPIVLAKFWSTTTEKAQKTLQATTWRGNRNMLHPSLSRKLCYHCLAHTMLAEMLFAITVSRRGNRCAKEYATNFGWARAFPMALRMETHETLSLLFAWDGFPPTYICDNAKERSKVSLLESYTPWSNAAEREILIPVCGYRL